MEVIWILIYLSQVCMLAVFLPLIARNYLVRWLISWPISVNQVESMTNFKEMQGQCYCRILSAEIVFTLALTIRWCQCFVTDSRTHPRTYWLTSHFTRKEAIDQKRVNLQRLSSHILWQSNVPSRSPCSLISDTPCHINRPENACAEWRTWGSTASWLSLGLRTWGRLPSPCGTATTASLRPRLPRLELHFYRSAWSSETTLALDGNWRCRSGTRPVKNASARWRPCTIGMQRQLFLCLICRVKLVLRKSKSGSKVWRAPVVGCRTGPTSVTFVAVFALLYDRPATSCRWRDCASSGR